MKPKSFTQAKPGEIYWFPRGDGNFEVGKRMEKTNTYLYFAECRTAEIAQLLIAALRKAHA